MGAWFIGEETPTDSCKLHHFSMKIVLNSSPPEYVSPLFLSILYTYDYRSIPLNLYLIKFSDDTALLNLLFSD